MTMSQSVSLLLTLAATAATLCVQVRFHPEDQPIRIDGKPFTTLHRGEDAAKPFLAPLYSASGKIVTRRFPMEQLQGKSRDHLHHRGLWFSYHVVNGTRFWEMIQPDDTETAKVAGLSERFAQSGQ